MLFQEMAFHRITHIQLQDITGVRDMTNSENENFEEKQQNSERNNAKLPELLLGNWTT